MALQCSVASQKCTIYVEDGDNRLLQNTHTFLQDYTVRVTLVSTRHRHENLKPQMQMLFLVIWWNGLVNKTADGSTGSGDGTRYRLIPLTFKDKM